MADKNVSRNCPGHVGIVELREAKGCLAQLAVFPLGLGQPLHQTFLMDPFDTSATLARVVQGVVGSSFASADTTLFWLAWVIVVLRVGVGVTAGCGCPCRDGG